jgi:DNA-binding transcriptional regulator YbjK
VPDWTNERFFRTNVQMLFEIGNAGSHTEEDRREVILEAAIRIIGEGGPDAITHRAVAARARVALGTVSYYFSSREELVREAFRFYLSSATRFLAGLERETEPGSVNELADFLVEVARREFMEPELVRSEYELILYAARDDLLAREFNSWERFLEAQLAARLERLGAQRPMDSSRTLIDLVRGFELERFTRPDADLVDLRRRLLPLLAALTTPASASNNDRVVRAESAPRHSTGRRRANEVTSNRRP